MKVKTTMAERTTTSNTGGIGVLGLLGVLFVGLKLTGYINWSWWWVTAPFWGGLAIAAVLLAAIALVVGCIEIAEHKRTKRQYIRRWPN